jgi:sugar porter (SP) family MFS transporter
MPQQQRHEHGIISDSDGEDDGIERIRHGTVAESGDGSITMTYENEDGNVVSVASRNNVSDKAAGKTPVSKKLRVALIAVFSALGSTLFGLDIGYIGPIIESVSFKHDVAHVKSATEQVDPTVEGLIVSLFSIGAMVTSFPVVSSYFLDVWGRKASIMVGTVVFVLGSAIQGMSMGETQLLIGRFVAGMSIGLLSSVIVLYQSEMAPASLRGALSTLYQMGITFGILIAAFIDQLLVERNNGWRMVMAIICIPAVGLIFGMALLSDSPRWLVQVGKRKEALKVLLTIRSEKEAIQEELEIYQEIEKAKQEGEPQWAELLRGRVFQLLLLGISLQLLQQLVGMNAFMYFGPKIFEAIGFDKNKFTVINNFVNFLSTFPAILLADRAGRRALMLWSSIGMTASCVVMGTLGLMYVEHTGGHASSANVTLSASNATDAVNTTLAAHSAGAGFVVHNHTAGWIIAASAFFFVFNFAYGFGPIVWVYCAEIFPLRYRARCVGVCTMANWVGNFIIAQFTPMMLASIQFGTFYVFGFFCAISIFLSAWLPETKGVPLELIQQLFDDKAGFRNTAEQKKLEMEDGSSSEQDSDS